MKKIGFLLLMIIITIISFISFQYRSWVDDLSDIKYDTIYVNENTTTYLIFEDSKVIWANIGNPKDFAVEKNNNTILIRSKKSNSESTNFIIELSDKKFLNGIILYKKDLINPVYRYRFYQEAIDSTKICDINDNQYGVEEYNSIGIYKDKMLIQVVNIYHDEHSFYFRLKVMNNSKIDYDIDMVKIRVMDSKTKSFKSEIKTLYDKKKILSGNEEYIHVCSELEAISEKELVYIEMIEKNGFRNFELIINSKTIQSSNKVK